MLNAKLSEGLGVLAQIPPASQAPGVVTTGWIPATNFHSILAVIQAGVLGAAATLDAKIQQAQDATGTGAKDLKSITQIVKTTGDNTTALIDVRGDDLDANNNYAFLQLSLTVGVAASQAGALLLGGNGRYEPVPQAASVAQVV